MAPSQVADTMLQQKRTEREALEFRNCIPFLNLFIKIGDLDGEISMGLFSSKTPQLRFLTKEYVGTSMSN